jgi:hypothetical protein
MSKILPKVNNCPLGENSPNLVTLTNGEVTIVPTGIRNGIRNDTNTNQLSPHCIYMYVNRQIKWLQNRMPF